MRGLTPALCAAVLSGCVLGHATKDIPPPGGCDECHRQRITSHWELTVAPVSLGRDGGVPEARDTALRELRALPYHQKVPTKRLVVYAASLPEAPGDQETGIQCFACHRSPNPPHEKARGLVHPWGRRERE